MEPLAPFVVEHKLCVGNLAVPLVSRMMELEDINDIAGGDQDEHAFECLELKTTSNASYIEQGLKLPAKFWKKNSHKLPLIIELREAIGTGKVVKGRMPRRPNSAVAIMLRGRVTMVRNSTTMLTLVAHPENTGSRSVVPRGGPEGCGEAHRRWRGGPRRASQYLGHP